MQSAKLQKIDDQHCSDCPIRHNAVCAKCDTDSLAQLETMKSYHRYAPGDVIAWAGEKLTTLGSIVSGVATLSSSLPDGRRQTVGLLLPSDFVGRPGRETVPYDVVAVNDVVICAFEKDKFETLIQQTPAIENRLLSMTLDELDAARDWMLLLGRKTAREKIASLILLLAEREARLIKMPLKDDARFALVLTREAIADYLGLTIETVSRQISALKREGVIALQGTRDIRIPSKDRLEEEAGID